MATGVPEVANQHLFLGIDRDRWLAGPPEAGDTGIDMLELGVAVRVLAALAGLGVGLQAEAHVLQQPPDHGVVDTIASLRQLARQMPLAAAHPQQRRLRVAANRRRDQLRQRLEQAGLLDHGRLAAATAAPHPADRPGRRGAVEVPQAAADRARNSRRLADRRDAATARRPRLAGREQTQAALIEVRRDGFVASTDGQSVDHTPSLRATLKHSMLSTSLFLRCSTPHDSFLRFCYFAPSPN
jgi:hypothetical protein